MTDEWFLEVRGEAFTTWYPWNNSRFSVYDKDHALDTVSKMHTQYEFRLAKVGEDVPPRPRKFAFITYRVESRPQYSLVSSGWNPLPHFRQMSRQTADNACALAIQNYSHVWQYRVVEEE